MFWSFKCGLRPNPFWTCAGSPKIRVYKNTCLKEPANFPFFPCFYKVFQSAPLPPSYFVEGGKNPDCLWVDVRSFSVFFLLLLFPSLGSVQVLLKLGCIKTHVLKNLQISLSFLVFTRFSSQTPSPLPIL